jgi:hypothetical protein
MEPYKISLVLAFALAVVELLTITFIFLSFALSLIVISILQYLTGEFSVNRDIFIFAVFSIFFTIVFRKFFKGDKDQKSLSDKDDDVNLY